MQSMNATIKKINNNKNSNKKMQQQKTKPNKVQQQ